MLIFIRRPMPILRLGLVTQDSKICKAVYSLPYATRLYEKIRPTLSLFVISIANLLNIILR